MLATDTRRLTDVAGTTGLVNSKAIDLQAGEGNTLVLTKNTKAAKNPTKALKKVELKKRHARQLKAVAAEVQNVRPDLKVCSARIVFCDKTQCVSNTHRPRRCVVPVRCIRPR